MSIQSAARNRIELFSGTIAKIKAGSKVTLSPRLADLEHVVKIYGALLDGDVETFKRGLVSVPTSIGGDWVIEDKFLMEEIGLADLTRDYSDLVTSEDGNATFDIVAVRFEGEKHWRDHMEFMVKEAKTPMYKDEEDPVAEVAAWLDDEVEAKRAVVKYGALVKCVGWSPTHLLPDDSYHSCSSIRLVTEPTHQWRCEDCRKKMKASRRKGGGNGGPRRPSPLAIRRARLRLK